MVALGDLCTTILGLMIGYTELAKRSLSALVVARYWIPISLIVSVLSTTVETGLSYLVEATTVVHGNLAEVLIARMLITIGSGLLGYLCRRIVEVIG